MTAALVELVIGRDPLFDHRYIIRHEYLCGSMGMSVSPMSGLALLHGSLGYRLEQIQIREMLHCNWLLHSCVCHTCEYPDTGADVGLLEGGG